MPNDWTAGRLESIVALADLQATALRIESVVSPAGTSATALRLELLGTFESSTNISAMRLELIVSSVIDEDDAPPLQGQAQYLHYGLQGHTGGIRKGPGPLF